MTGKQNICCDIMKEKFSYVLALPTENVLFSRWAHL